MDEKKSAFFGGDSGKNTNRLRASGGDTGSKKHIRFSHRNTLIRTRVDGEFTQIEEKSNPKEEEEEFIEITSQSVSEQEWGMDQEIVNTNKKSKRYEVTVGPRKNGRSNLISQSAGAGAQLAPPKLFSQVVKEAMAHFGGGAIKRLETNSSVGFDDSM